MLELLFAVSKIGAVIVPLNWRLAAPELSVILAGSLALALARALLAGSAFAPLAEQLVAQQSPAPELIVVSEDGVRGYQRWLPTHEPQDPGERGDVVVQYVRLGDDRRAERSAHDPQESGRGGRDLPTLGVRRELGQPHAAADVPYRRHGVGVVGLTNGATTIPVSDFDPMRVLDTLEHRRVTNAVLVPTMLQMLTSMPGAAEREFSAPRSIAYRASPITTKVLKCGRRARFGVRCSASTG